MKTKFNVRAKAADKEIPVDKTKLISMLYEVLCEEWLAYYQSWIGAILMEGPLKNEIKPELFIHATQELNHALSLKERLHQLGFSKEFGSSDQKKQARCQPPLNYHIESILNKNLDNERITIERYRELADYTIGRDPVTYQVISKILDDELNHVKAIQEWLGAITKVKEKKFEYSFIA
jgi:bacterioferritin